MRNKDYCVSIVGSKMFFNHHGTLLFTATVTHNNTALLDGITEPMTEFASLISTCPLDITLWHQCFSHLNFGDMQHLVTKELVDGITMKSHASPDPICEPCIAGKQHRIVNKTASHATQPLALVHSDLHGPLSLSAVQRVTDTGLMMLHASW